MSTYTKMSRRDFVREGYCRYTLLNCFTNKILFFPTAYTNFDITDSNSFWKIHCFTFFPYKSIKDQIWTCCKKGQGQPRVIIWTNLVVLEHPMLHTKFQDHLPFGFGENSLRFLSYMSMVATLVMWPGPFEQNFFFLTHGGSIWNLASTGPVASEEKMFENVDDGQRRPTYPISSPMSLWLRAQVS